MKRNTKIDQIMSKYVESIDLNKENDLKKFYQLRGVRCEVKRQKNKRAFLFCGIALGAVMLIKLLGVNGWLSSGVKLEHLDKLVIVEFEGEAGDSIAVGTEETSSVVEVIGDNMSAVQGFLGNLKLPTMKCRRIKVSEMVRKHDLNQVLGIEINLISAETPIREFKAYYVLRTNEIKELMGLDYLTGNAVWEERNISYKVEETIQGFSYLIVFGDERNYCCMEIKVDEKIDIMQLMKIIFE